MFKMGTKGLGYYHDVPLAGALHIPPLHLSDHVMLQTISMLVIEPQLQMSQMRFLPWAESKSLQEMPAQHESLTAGPI